MKNDSTTRRLLNSRLVKKGAQVYKRYERWYPIASFAAGFAWDSLTLTRIDRLSDNLIILLYLLALGALIVLTHLSEENLLNRPALLVKYQRWLPVGTQFLFGGVFSSYVVFYFKSAGLTKNLLFVLFLFLLLISNEFFEKRLSNLKIQLGLYFLSVFAFCTFFFPVIFKVMNNWMFALSGLISLLVITLLFYVLHRLDAAFGGRLLYIQGGIILGVYLLINLLYFFNWIPPVPLSMKDGGVYHHVHKEQKSYHLIYEATPWYNFWRTIDPAYHYTPGDTVFCFVSVFAPTRLTKRIYHHWQYYDARRETWVTSDVLGYKISGGREGGYRGYTMKNHMRPGEWRVDVETSEKKILGRIAFDVQPKEGQTIHLKKAVK